MICWLLLFVFMLMSPNGTQFISDALCKNPAIQNAQFSIVSDTLLKASIMTVLPLKSLLSCAFQCNSNSNCEFFGIDTGNHLCLLLTNACITANFTGIKIYHVINRSSNVSMT